MRILIIVFLILAMTNVQANDSTVVDTTVAQAAPADTVMPGGGIDALDRYAKVIRGITCGDGTCGGGTAGEDCISCPEDCPSGATASCGDGVCNISDGEDCLNCPDDCNGKQNGRPANRFCCGNGGGQGPVGCDDSRCSTGGFICASDPSPSSCCGDGVCDIGESCSADGLAAEEVCDSGGDEDCDAAIDCDDPDCATYSACLCLPRGEACADDGDCCSSRCRGMSGAKVCK